MAEAEPSVFTRIIEREIPAEVADRVLAHMRDSGSAPELRAVDEFDDDALIVSVGFVNNGLPISDLRPVGDEFTALLTNAALTTDDLDFALNAFTQAGKATGVLK